MLRRKQQSTTGPEEELIRQAQSGDTAAFSQLVEKYSPVIFNVACRMLGDREDASDMTQEALIKIYRFLPRFRGDSAFSTWVYRIAVNTCRDHLRSACRRRELPFSDFAEEEDEGPVFEVADDSFHPEKLFIEADQLSYLRTLIDSLKPPYRMVLSLRELGGLTYQEIADVCHLSTGTVKSRLNRARAAMREQIQKDAEQYPELLRLMGKGGAEDGV